MDPSGGGVSKAAGELLKEMQQAQQELQQMQEQQEPSGANFQSTMEAQQTQSAQQVEPTFIHIVIVIIMHSIAVLDREK